MNNIVVLLIGNIDYDSRVQKEISTFISLGYHVTLITWSWQPVLYHNENVDIIEVNLSNYKDPNNAILKFWKTIKFWFISANIIKKGNYKYIHCNDLSTLGTIFFLPKRYYSRIVYDAHELYPEMYEINSLKYRFWSYIERNLIKKVENIISPELNRADYLKQKYELERRPYVINNFPRFEVLTPVDVKKKLKLSSEKKILCYHGIIFGGRQIENIVESLGFLPDNFVLVLIGYADERYVGELKEFIVSKRLEKRVFFYGKVPPKEMPQTIAGCDISIALYENNRMNNYLCASNKVFESIMAGIKVITNDYPPHKILKNYEFVGLVSKPEPERIADCARYLDECGSEIPENIKRRFSWDSFHELFKKIYK